MNKKSLFPVKFLVLQEGFNFIFGLHFLQQFI